MEKELTESNSATDMATLSGEKFPQNTTHDAEIGDQNQETADQTEVAGAQENCSTEMLPNQSDVAGPSSSLSPDKDDLKSEKAFYDETDLKAENERAEAAKRLEPSGDSNHDIHSTKQQDDMKSLYHIKWIDWGGDRTPIVTQNENGPCPLIAIFNVLLLSKKVLLGKATEIISTNQIMSHVAEVIWDAMPKELPDDERLNYEQNVSDAMSVFPNLQTGLDVNVKFFGVNSFEYTPELTVFDLLRIPLYHGWLIDPQDEQVQNVIGKLSYNQIVEKIITCKSSSDDSIMQEGLVAEQFLESTASQITCHGIVSLCEQIKPGSLAVLFRNNHFSTLFRHNNELFTLVTDLGFLRESNVIWETLSSVQGDSHFVDGRFLNSPPKAEVSAQAMPAPNTDYDYQIALSLQQGQVPETSTGVMDANTASDYELAMQLNREEQLEAQRRQQTAERTTGAGKSRPHTASQQQVLHTRELRPESAPQRGRNSQEGNDSKCAIL